MMLISVKLAALRYSLIKIACMHDYLIISEFLSLTTSRFVFYIVENRLKLKSLGIKCTTKSTTIVELRSKTS